VVIVAVTVVLKKGNELIVKDATKVTSGTFPDAPGGRQGDAALELEDEEGHTVAKFRLDEVVGYSIESKKSIAIA
jgi:hypothetical protein